MHEKQTLHRIDNLIFLLPRGSVAFFLFIEGFQFMRTGFKQFLL